MPANTPEANDKDPQLTRIRILLTLASSAPDLTALANTNRLEIEKISPLCRDVIRFYWRRGDDCFDQGKFTDAAIEYYKANICAPQLALLHFQCGLALLLGTHFLEAEKSFTIGLRQFPRCFLAIAYRALARYEIGDNVGALADCYGTMQLGYKPDTILRLLGATMQKYVDERPSANTTSQSMRNGRG